MKSAKRTTAEYLRRAAEIVQWSVDVRPEVSQEQLAEAREVRAALLRATDAQDVIAAALLAMDSNRSIAEARKDYIRLREAVAVYRKNHG